MSVSDRVCTSLNTKVKYYLINPSGKYDYMSTFVIVKQNKKYIKYLKCNNMIHYKCYFFYFTLFITFPNISMFRFTNNDIRS